MDNFLMVHGHRAQYYGVSKFTDAFVCFARKLGFSSIKLNNVGVWKTQSFDNLLRMTPRRLYCSEFGEFSFSNRAVSYSLKRRCLEICFTAFCACMIYSASHIPLSFPVSFVSFCVNGVVVYGPR